MLFFRHPKPVIDGRAVAVQIAQRKVETTGNNRVLVVERKPDQPLPGAPVQKFEATIPRHEAASSPLSD
jgi:hypothetical protein